MSTDFATTMTVLTTFPDVAEALRSYDFVNAMESFHQGTLMTLQGSDHTERRRVEAPLFRVKLLEQYERDTLVPALKQELASCVRAGFGEPVRIDLVPTIQRAVLRVTARLIGLDDVDSPEAAEVFGGQMDRLAAAGLPAFYKGDVEALLHAAEQARDEFRALFYWPAVKRRRQALARHDRAETSGEELPSDLITALMRHGYPDPEVEKEATLFATASVSTTVRESLFVLRRLLDWVKAHPEDAAAAAEPDFLSPFIGETMRLDPIVPGLFRQASRDQVLPSGRHIRAGEKLYLDIEAADRDPSVFGADAEQFVPRRATTDGVFSYALSFGAGPHKCIGAPLAFGANSSSGSGRRGEMQAIIITLLDAGVDFDPDDPPVENSQTRIREFTTFPVLLTGGTLETGEVRAP